MKRKSSTKTKLAEKVKEDDLTQPEEDDQPRKRKKLKHRVLADGWGCIEKVVTNLTEMTCYVPQPQRQGCRLRGNRLSKDDVVVAVVPVPEDRLISQDIRKFFPKVGTVSTVSKDDIYRKEETITFASLMMGTDSTGVRRRRPRKVEERREGGYGPINKYLTLGNTRDTDDDELSTTPPVGKKRKPGPICVENSSDEIGKVVTPCKRLRL